MGQSTGPPPRRAGKDTAASGVRQVGGIGWPDGSPVYVGFLAGTQSSDPRDVGA